MPQQSDEVFEPRHVVEFCGVNQAHKYIADASTVEVVPPRCFIRRTPKVRGNGPSAGVRPAESDPSMFDSERAKVVLAQVQFP